MYRWKCRKDEFIERGIIMPQLSNKKIFTVSREKNITEELVKKIIDLHKARLVSRYIENERLYMADHDILRLPPKEVYKPDNRLLANYAKYIVDTFSGFHLGIPVKITHKNPKVDMFLQDFRVINDMQDTEYEIGKMCDIFGHSFIYIYQDENSNTRITYDSPINMIMVYDDTVEERPYFAIRYSKSKGEVLTDSSSIDFKIGDGGDIKFFEEISHNFNGVPVVEVIENEERQGIFDSVKTLINALNKAISEKANDVDYFADAYLKVVGVELDNNQAKILRESRIINIFGDVANADVGFLEKPNADTTQQNLIELIIKLIFDISMVANLSNEDFGASSGTALAFKLQPMSNMASLKDRKMVSAFNRMYALIFSLPNIPFNDMEWVKIDYKFTRNMPKNIKEEAEVVKILDGQVSNETKLSILSFIENTKEELEKIDKEETHASELSKQIAKNDRFTDGDLVE